MIVHIHNYMTDKEITKDVSTPEQFESLFGFEPEGDFKKAIEEACEERSNQHLDMGVEALADQIQKLGEIPLGYQPGTQWVYSISVDVQGYLVEVLSGQPFDEFLQQRIFGPLGMVDTSFYVEAAKASRLAGQYRPGTDGTLQRSDNGDFLEKPAFFSGGGGLTSTASDYMKFAQMHLNGGELNGTRILSEAAVQIMRSNQLPDSIDGIGALYPGNVFGVDFAVVNDSAKFNGAPEGTHWWWGIAGSWFWIDPVQNIVFVGMIQNDDIMYSIQTHGAMRGLLYQ